MPADPLSAFPFDGWNSFTRRDWLRRRLLAWFAREARVLPWRGNRDPYRIWVSEVMLQQTQVATVIAYFERFLRKYATLTELARAEEAEVLRLWEGLGYYRRARDLWRAARILSAAGFTNIPDDPELVRALPGFGRYTANAVLSQAYERRVPILEANSQRVLCRLIGIDEDPKQTIVQKTLWRVAEIFLPKKEVGAFNQALMELGALVCTPAAPKCRECPLHAHCQARLDNRQDEIPRRAKSARIVTVEEVAIVLRRRKKILLVQRPDEGRWGKMWECPHLEVEWLEPHATAARRLLAKLGIEAEIGAEIATIRHSVTRFQITMVCLEAAHRRGTPRTDSYLNAAWVSVAELGEYPLSAPQRLLAQRLAIG